MITLNDKISYPNLPMCEKFSNFTENSTKEILPVAHTTVRTRLGFAKKHLEILRQAENSELKRAMFEDVTINLVSSFEAIAHVLNGFYDLGIEDRIVTIDHKRRHIQQSESCLRCKLREANLPLANLLDQVLKIGSPVEE